MTFATERDAFLALSFTPHAPVTVEISKRVAQPIPIVAITGCALSPPTASACTWIEVAQADCGVFRAVSGTFA